MSIPSTASELDSLGGLTAAKRLASRLAAGRDLGIQAVMLYGASGSGKTSVGMFIAKAWMCLADDSRPCGECISCRAFDDGLAADFLTVRSGSDGNQIRLYQVSEGQAPPGAESTISIQRFIRTMPLQSSVKVVLVEQAERLNGQAANSFLKMLEEPPPYARFVLTSSQFSAVPSTIRSRCICAACEVPDDLGTDPFNRGASVADRQYFERFESIVQRIRHLAKASIEDGARAAMRDSLELREIAKAIGAESGGRARQANLQALELLTRAYLSEGAAERAYATIEAHRSVLGNGSFGITADALFARFQGGKAGSLAS